MHFKRLILHRIIGLWLVFFILTSCNKSHTFEIKKFKEDRGVFIVNEGNFTYSNSSLSFYNPDSMLLLNDVFYDSNGFPLGDAFQSMCVKDSIAYLCISNSGRVMVMNINTFKHIANIKIEGSPRNMLVINNETAWVSDLNNPFITVINLLENTVSGQIWIGNSSEEMLKNEDFVFINSWSYNNKIYVLNPVTEKLVDSILVTKQPNSMAFDKDGNLWVLSDGGYEGSPYGQENAALNCIDPISFKIKRSYLFKNINDSPSGLTINGGGDSLFFIGGVRGSSRVEESGIVLMSIYANELPEKVYIHSEGRNFYGLGIHPENSDIYCSDALGYLEKGKIYRYSSKAQLLDSFSVGLVPGSFVFK